MRDSIRTVDALRSALSARRDLFLEHLALRHQVGILARSNRRFRAADRLLWLCLRSLWPTWRQALLLVEPATVVGGVAKGSVGAGAVARTGHREDHASIRTCEPLIRRMAAENRLWGAPRIHGELLTLGIGVSERTVSRYLANTLSVQSRRQHRRTAATSCASRTAKRTCACHSES